MKHIITEQFDGAITEHQFSTRKEADRVWQEMLRKYCRQGFDCMTEGNETTITPNPRLFQPRHMQGKTGQIIWRQM
jgi:hypothetical protein